MEGCRRKYRPSSLTYITQTQLTSDWRIKKVDLLSKHFLLHWYRWRGRNNERPHWWKALLATKVKLVAMRKGEIDSFWPQQNTADKSINVLHSLIVQDCKDSSLKCPQHVDVGGQCPSQTVKGLNLQGLCILINILVICISLTNVFMV